LLHHSCPIALFQCPMIFKVLPQFVEAHFRTWWNFSLREGRCNSSRVLFSELLISVGVRELQEMHPPLLRLLFQHNTQMPLPILILGVEDVADGGHFDAAELFKDVGVLFEVDDLADLLSTTLFRLVLQCLLPKGLTVLGYLQ